MAGMNGLLHPFLLSRTVKPNYLPDMVIPPADIHGSME